MDEKPRVEIGRIWGSYVVERLIGELSNGGCDEICVSAEAMAAYEARRIAAAKGTIFASGCSSWYLDREGVPMTWPWSYQAFAEAMASPVMEDMERRNSKRVAV